MIKKIISYLFPLTRYIESDFNGQLELTMIDGKTFLNTRNTNYSYGSLQKVLKFSLTHTDLSRVRSILVLGLGGGSVLKTLRNEFGYTGRIISVDIDPVIIEIAKNEYQITEDEETEIICSDAFDYIKNVGNKFDLIIIDLFIDNKVPDKFLLIEFWHEVIDRLNTHGTIIFNTLCNPFTDTRPVEKKLTRRGLEWRLFRHVEKTNKVLIANFH